MSCGSPSWRKRVGEEHVQDTGFVVPDSVMEFLRKPLDRVGT